MEAAVRVPEEAMPVLMSKELISAMIQAAAGLALGYLVFVDDERLAWPVWLLIAVAATVLTVASNRVLVHARRPLKTRAAVTSLGAVAMVAAPLVWEPATVGGGHPLRMPMTIVLLLILCNLYFLPAWIAALVPARYRIR